MAYPKGRVRLPGHDPLFNILTCAYAHAFRLADGHDPEQAQQARVEIVAVFSHFHLKRLHQQALITWNPEEIIV